MKPKLSGTLVLVGAGKMGGAMLEAWINSGIPARQLVAIDPAVSDDMTVKLASWGVSLNPPMAEVTDAEVILIAVKPQVLDDVLPGLVSLAASRPLVVSVVAGKTIAAFEHHFGTAAAVIRTMPNTPAAIGRGITAMASNSNVSQAQKSLAAMLLASVGEVVQLTKEADIDAVTAVSGSGPAYVFYMTECLTKAAEALGLPAEVSVQLARATVAGAGELMRQSGTDAATLRKNVTSPKGTTEAALNVLMAAEGLEPLMKKAVNAACERSRELAK